MKVIKNVVLTVITLVLIWAVASYVDIVSDNTHPNPQHASWNMFILAANATDDGQCGNPITTNTRADCGVILSIDGDTLEIVTEDGNLWEVEVGNGGEFSEADYLCVFFDTQGTEIVQDDEIIKLFVERW